MKNKFILTKHLCERFKERFYNYLSKDELKDEYLMKEKLWRILDDSSEDKSFINNSSVIERLYNKHGYDVIFSFFVYKECVFACLQKSIGRYVIMTCFDSKWRNCPIPVSSKNNFR